MSASEASAAAASSSGEVPPSAGAGGGASRSAKSIMTLGFNADEKRAAFASVTSQLEDFFGKYKGIDMVARMSTINSFLAYHFPYWHFVGFYVVRVIDGAPILHVGPYQGKVLATAIIPFGRGQCGACAAEDKTQIQEDVSTCANYIPCDDVTRSEIVVPVHGRNFHNEAEAPPEAPKRLIAVLDIDSEVLAAFDEVDKAELEKILATFI